MWKNELKEVLGERVAFDEEELRLYSHDLAVLPDRIGSLLNRVPDAVAQPASADDVVFLVNFANVYGIPLVPRGNGTSGDGGSLPTKGGIVVEFNRMPRVLKINENDETVTVEPGITWLELEEELKKSGLMLRLYPTSAPGSTVGGWVAKGGMGIGSYEYGRIKENILEAEIVTPQGEVEQIKGDKLKLVSGCEGITGIITKVTLRVKKHERTLVKAAVFPKLRNLALALKQIGERELPLWSVSFETSEFVKLQQRATGKHLIPGNSQIAVFAYPESRKGEVEVSLAEIVVTNKGFFTDDDVATEKWEERFYPMRFKVLGPSLIPSEAVVPVEKLAGVVEEQRKRMSSELAVEGVMLGREQCSLRGYLLHDELSRKYEPAFGKALTFIEIARKHGGEYYSIGMYFTEDAPAYFDAKVLDSLVEYKREKDPQGIMNPGKLLPPSLDDKSPLRKLNAMMSLARKGKTALGLAEKIAFGKKGLRRDVIGDEVVKDAFTCALCGFCKYVCPLYLAKPWESSTPRGQFFFLKEYLRGNHGFDARIADIFGSCTTCGRCATVCQTMLQIPERWLSMRSTAVEGMGYPPPVLLLVVRRNIIQTGNMFGEPIKGRVAWVPKDVSYLDEGELAYFAGCGPCYNSPNVNENVGRILNKAGVEFAYLGEDEYCCSYPMTMSGQLSVVEKAVEHNIKEFNRRGIKTIVTACGSCYWVLGKRYPLWAEKLGLEYDIEVKNVFELIHDLVKTGKIKFEKPVKARVTYHDPCHVGRWGGVYEPPRELLKSLPGVEYVEMRHAKENAICCSTPPLRVRHPDWSDRILDARISEAVEAGAEIVTSACTPCEFMLRVGSENVGAGLRVTDITDLVAEAMGLEVHDAQATQLFHSRWVMMKTLLDTFGEMPREKIVETSGQILELPIILPREKEVSD